MERNKILQDKKILITGGGGFFGSHLAKFLKEKNKVTAIGRNYPNDLEAGINFIPFDITDPEFITFFENNYFDFVFHLAGNASQQHALEDPTCDMETNFLATFKMLDILRKRKNSSTKKISEDETKFVFASSVTVYGDCGDKKLSEDNSVLLPISNYGASKLAAEKYLFAFVKQYGIKAITLRIFSTYGPGLKRQIVYDLIEKLEKNPHELEILGDGTQSRDMTYISDQIQNIIKIVNNTNFAGEVYNLGSGIKYTTKQIAQAITTAMNLESQLKFTQPERIYDAPIWVANIEKIKKFGCNHSVTLEEGVKRTVDWYHQKIKKFI